MIRELIIVLVTLGAVGFAGLYIARLFGMWGGETMFSIKLFPELNDIPSDERKKNFRKAWKAAWRERWVAALFLSAGGSCIAFIALPKIFPSSIIWILYSMAIMSLTEFAVLALLRMEMRRYFWVEFARRGLPICARCGYDLTGNESGVCPECGTSI